MKDKDAFQLTQGSQYVIRSLEARDKPLESRGIFKGYTAIAQDDALCIELDESHGDLKGKYRVIPTHMVLAIDVITHASAKKKPEEDSTARYFG